MKSEHCKQWVGCAAAAWLVMAGTAQADNLWTNTASGSWFNGTNWSGGVPSTGDSHNFITNNNSKTVSISAPSSGSDTNSLTINKLSLWSTSGATNTLALLNAGVATPLHMLVSCTVSNGGAITITNSALQVDASSFGALNILGGSVRLDSGAILLGSTVTTRVGRVSSGSLTINGGTFQGTALLVGEFAGSRGTLTIAGGQVNLSGSLDCGQDANSTGVVWVTGGQLLATNDLTRIGNNLGVGEMTLSNAATVFGNSISVGRDSGSRGALTIAGGVLNLSSRLSAGRFAGSTGTVWMTGGQLQVPGSTVRVGDEGIGEMTVSNGTVLARDVLVATNVTARGTLTLAGGSVAATSLVLGDFACAATGVVTMTAGNLFVTNALATGVVDVRSGTMTLSGGVLTTDKLVVTNVCGRFIRNGGTLTLNSGPPMLGVGMDADGDGLPNDWESSFLLDPLSPTGNDGADGDPDGDGYTNLQEFSAGTAPNSAASLPQVADIVRSGNDIIVKIQSVVGKTYQLQRRDSLTSGMWEDVPGTMQGTGGLVSLTDTGAALQPQRNYQVKIIP